MGNLFKAQSGPKSTTALNRAVSGASPDDGLDSDFFGSGAYYADGTPVGSETPGAVGGTQTATNVNDEDA